MEIIYLNDYVTIEDEVCLALGFFDGLHIGHYALFNKVIELSNQYGFKKGMLTFDHHPAYILGNITSDYYLESFDDRMKEISELGFDYVFVVPFTKMVSKLDADTFIQEYIQPLNVKHVVCGIDFNFGKDGLGNATLLKTYFDTSVVDDISHDGQKVSSTRIRNLLKEGNVEFASQLLNKTYSITGKVIKGKKLGRMLGFPTSNIDFRCYVLPKRGVYASLVKVGDKIYQSMTNVGKNPTITDLIVPSLEVNIFDFDEDIYGETITVQFLHYIREEKKFEDVKHLQQQLKTDKEQVLEYFKKNA